MNKKNLNTKAAERFLSNRKIKRIKILQKVQNKHKKNKILKKNNKNRKNRNLLIKVDKITSYKHSIYTQESRLFTENK